MSRSSPSSTRPPRTVLLEVLQEVPDEVESVMLIGHNPGIQDLALSLAGAGSEIPRLRSKFPTAALATIAVPPPWSALERGDGTVLDMVRPKQLPG